MAERQYGQPRTNVERAIAHYGITEEEYCANPEAYPLPERGTGLSNPSGLTLTYFIIMGFIGFLVYQALYSKKRAS